MSFTHERSWNEDCILHVRIPFSNWISGFLWIDWKIMNFFDERNRFFKSSHVISEIIYMAHSEEVLINYFREVIRYQVSLPPQENGWVIAWTVLWTAPFGTLLFHGPQSSIEKVNDFVPCIKRQRFTVTGLKLWWLLFIFSADFRLSYENSSQRINFLVKIRDSFGFSF